MAYIRAHCILPNVNTGDSADDVVNVLHFNTPNTGETSRAAVQAGVEAFYDTLRLGNSVDNDNCYLKLYDAEAPKPNYPFWEGSWTRTPPASISATAPQLALVISFFNDTETSIPRARRRGRIYIGHLPTDIITTGQNVAPSAITNMQNSLAAMDTALGPDGVHCGWSHVRNTGFFIDRYRVDNSIDVQRRRKIPATTESEWAGPG